MRGRSGLPWWVGVGLLVGGAAEAAPDVVAALDALAAVPEGYAVERDTCSRHTPKLVHQPYLVVTSAAAPGRTWACTAAPELVCGEVAGEGCTALEGLTAGPLPAGLSGDALAALIPDQVRPIRGAPGLVVVEVGREHPRWWFGLRSADGDVVSAEVIPGSDEVYEDRLTGRAPPVDLSAVFGGPAWGLPTVRGGEGMGNNASGGYTYGLLVLARAGDALVDVARVPLGSEGFSRGLSEAGPHGSSYHDVRCPVVHGVELRLYRSCSSDGDPRDASSGSGQGVCDPSCRAGRAPVARYVARDGALVAVGSSGAGSSSSAAPRPE